MLKIGRAEFSRQLGDDTPATVDDFTVSGDELSISGAIHREASVFGGAAQSRASAAMQRTNGLINSRDEAVVPVIWDDGPPDVDGFYRVVGGSVSGDSTRGPRGVMPFSLTLQRVTGFAAPMFEDIVRGGKRDRSYDSIGHQSYIGLPATARGFEIGADLTPLSHPRQAEDGLMTLYYNDANTLDDATPAFYVPPEDWYTGAATLRVADEIVVGRQARNRPTDWEITNGLIRFRGMGGLSDINVQRFDPDASPQWATFATLQPGMNVGPAGALGDLPAPHTLTVKRNSPEEVSIRLTYDLQSKNTSGRFAVTLDITLRRGSAIASFSLLSRGTYRYQLDVAGWGLTAGTYTGGASLNSAVIGWDEGTITSSAASGKPSGTRRFTGPSGASAMIWGFGWSASTEEGEEFDHPGSIIDQWCSATNEFVDAVVR